MYKTQNKVSSAMGSLGEGWGTRGGGVESTGLGDTNELGQGGQDYPVEVNPLIGEGECNEH